MHQGNITERVALLINSVLSDQINNRNSVMELCMSNWGVVVELLWRYRFALWYTNWLNTFDGRKPSHSRRLKSAHDRRTMNPMSIYSKRSWLHFAHCKRAHELGWAALFDEFESSSSSTSEICRIGSPLITFLTSSESNVSCSTSACASWWPFSHDAQERDRRTYPVELFYFRC